MIRISHGSVGFDRPANEPVACGLLLVLSAMQAAFSIAQTKRGPMAWRMVRMEEADDRFDLAFWQAQSAELRFAAAWEMVETAWEVKGRSPDELRLQRTLVRFERLPG